MKRTKNKKVERSWYAIGCTVAGSRHWGLKAWDINLPTALLYKGVKGDRILLFTKQGLQPRYKWRKNEWRKIV